MMPTDDDTSPPTLLLHRGLAIRTDCLADTRTRILASGFQGADERGVGRLWRLRSRLEDLMADPTLYRTGSFDEAKISFFCGDVGGAAFYARRESRNRERTPVVVSVRIGLDQVVVDCRDFLCTVFQLWDCGKTPRPQQQVARDLESLFGGSIQRYFATAAASNDQQVRIAMCNAASHDPDVVRGHAANQRVIRGRYDTVFKSAFAVWLPVTAAQIVAFEDASDLAVQTPEISLDDVLGSLRRRQSSVTQPPFPRRSMYSFQG